jgi:hypothetical protein
MPKLTNEAIITIKYGGGLAEFERRYGDYYVAGYRLGGDTGVLVGTTGDFSSTTETLSVEVTVQVLFWSDTYSTSTTTHSESHSATVTVLGYDTLTNLHVSKMTKLGVFNVDVGQDAQSLIHMAQSLPTRVDQKMAEVNLPENEPLSYEICDRLTKAGLVAELVLLPVGTMREVLVWATNDNII